MNKKLVATGVLIAALAPAAGAAERFWIQHSEIAELFEKFGSIAPEKRANLSFRVKVSPMNKAPLQGISLQMRAKAGTTRIEVAPDGVIAFPLSPQLRREDPPIWVDSPEAVKVAIGIDVLIALPKAPTVRYGEVMDSVKLAGDGMRKHAGIWALFMPKPDGLELRFPPGEAAGVSTRDGKPRTWNADARGVVIVPLTDDLKSENPTLVFSRAPLEARPYFKTLMQLVPDGEATVK